MADRLKVTMTMKVENTIMEDHRITAELRDMLATEKQVRMMRMNRTTMITKMMKPIPMKRMNRMKTRKHRRKQRKIRNKSPIVFYLKYRFNHQ